MMIADRSMVCIDWDERSLRVLDGQFRRGGMKVRKALHVPLPAETDPRDPVGMGAFLRRTLAEHRIRTRRAIVDVPRQEAVFTSMTLPRGSKEEIAAMVHVQAAKELPFAKDQAVVDFAMSPGAKEGMCEIWVAAVRTAVVERYRQTVVNAGLKPERIGLRPYANVAALLPEPTSTDRVLMVDIGPTMTEINVVAEGRLMYSRAASVSVPPEGLTARLTDTDTGAAQPTLAGDTVRLLDEPGPRPLPLDALLIEVGRTVEAYRMTSPGSTINRVVIAGTGGPDEQVIERFEQRFAAPARVYEVPEIVAWRRSKEMSTAPFSAVVGLALSSLKEAENSFDFLNPKEPEAVERERKRQRPMLVATVALFVVAGGVLAYQPFKGRKAEINRIKAVIREVNSDQKARKELFDRMDDVRAWQAKNIVWIDKFKRLAEAFPSNQEGYITRLECNEKGTLSLDMVTKQETVAAGIVLNVAELKDAKGRPLYQAKVGNKEDSRLPDYPVKDKVIIELQEMKETKQGS